MSVKNRFFSERVYAAPFGRYEAGNEVESPADEVLVGREGQRAYFIDLLSRGGRRGAYLVTGHRGIGKSNFVRYCLEDYKREVFERFLRGNVGRATFWDRILALVLLLVLVVSALMISELMELISLAIRDVGLPRNILFWFVLAPLAALCLFPMLFAAEVTRRVLRTARGLGRRLPVSVVVAACIALLWCAGPFGAPALSLSRLLCSLAALYLWFQCTSFRRLWPTLVFLAFLAFYVFFFQDPIVGLKLNPLEEFRGNAQLAFLLVGMGCIFQSRVLVRLKSSFISADVRAAVSQPYLWVGLASMLLGLTHSLYRETWWALWTGAGVMGLAFFSSWFWAARQKKEESVPHFYPEPLLVLSFKAFLALVVSLQLLHPAVASTRISGLVVKPSESTRNQGWNKIRAATSLRQVPGIKKPDRRPEELGASAPAAPVPETAAEDKPRQSLFHGEEEEIRWILAVFLSVLLLSFLEYEWLVRPFLRQRADQSLDPASLKVERDLPVERQILRGLAEVTLPWLLFRAWLPVLVIYVNLGFERLDHRRVVHAMLESLRTSYHRAFLAWNSAVATLGRFFGFLVLLLLVAIVGERWFAMPEDWELDRAVLRSTVLNDYRQICDLFGGRQQGPGAVNVICKLPAGEAVFHILTYNLASVRVSAWHQEQTEHLLYYLFPFTKDSWPREKTLQEIRLGLADGRVIGPLFENGVHLRVYHLLLFLLFYLAGKFVLRRLPIFPYGEVQKRIDEVKDQISSTTSLTSTTGLPRPSNWLRGFFVDERVRQVQQEPMDPRTVEFLFLGILEDIQSSAIVLPGGGSQRISLPAPELIFVFDELDKLGSPVDPSIDGMLDEARQQREIINAERRRSAELHRLLADMKNLLSASSARFIFVGGRNLHDEWLADQTARQPLLTNIFNAEIYLPSLLADYSRRDGGGIHRNINAYLRAQVRRAVTLHAVARRKESSSFLGLKVETHVNEAFVSSSREMAARVHEIAEGLEKEMDRLGLAVGRMTSFGSQSLFASLPLDRAVVPEQTDSDALLAPGFDQLGRDQKNLETALQNVNPAYKQLTQKTGDLIRGLRALERSLKTEEIHLEDWDLLRRKLPPAAEELATFDNALALVREEVRDLAGSLDALAQRLKEFVADGRSPERLWAGEMLANIGEALADLRLIGRLSRVAGKVAEKRIVNLKKEIDRIEILTRDPVELMIFDVEGEELSPEDARRFVTDFVQFLAYRSKGNPKRLKEIVAGFVRPVGRAVEDQDVRREKFPCEHVLLFDDVARFRIQLLARLYRFLVRSFRARVHNYDDKLVISILFLADFLFKFHRRGFSWSNLERVDELVDIHRAPDLREVFGRMVVDWTSRILHPIRNGMYDFRFLSEMAHEIEYISRESQEEMAAFNFTLDESLALKSIYESTIRQLSAEGRRNELVDLTAGLGELYEFDQEYETARLYYRKAILLVDADLREVIGGGELIEKQSPALEIMGALPKGQRHARLYMTWGVNRLRLMLQIGMTYELARNYEKAEVEYRNAYTLARSLLLAMLDAEGRGRALDLGLASRLVVAEEDRLQELKHLNLLFQPAFAEAWIGEKLAGGVDTSIGLVERELRELRQILPFVRESKVEPATSPIDFSHSNFSLIISELHNKAGDLYFMKGRQLVHWENLLHVDQAAGEKSSPRRGQEGYLLQAHYHYCVALHELRRFVAHRRLSSKHQLNIWTADVFRDRWPTLSEAAWPAFVYSAAGEAFNDVAEAMIARVSLYGLLKRLTEVAAVGCSPGEGTSKAFRDSLLEACSEWLDSENSADGRGGDPWNLTIAECDIRAGSVSGWLGVWREDREGEDRFQDGRLLNFDEWEDHDDHTRLAVAINFMLVGAKYLERGGYLEDAARELLKVCETVTSYLWWELAVQRLIDWKVLDEESRTKEGQPTLRALLEEIMSEDARKARLPFWSYLVDVAVDALDEADQIFHRCRSGEALGKEESPIGPVLPSFSLILACSLGLASSHLGGDLRRMAATFKRWTNTECTVDSLRKMLKQTMHRFSYPLQNRLQGLVTLIQDGAIDKSGPAAAEDLLRWSAELKELQERLAAPLYFTPLSSGVAYGLVFWYCWHKSPKEQRRIEAEVGKTAERDLAASHEMFTLRATYYESISRLYYLYDGFNDRQVHFSHASQMAGSELATALRYMFYLNRILDSSTA